MTDAAQISVWQNLVLAVNSFSQTIQKIQGQASLSAISASTVVATIPGRLVSVSVTSAGTGTGLIYDSAALTATTRPIYVIPEAVGLYPVGIPTNYGIVVVPGPGQIVTVTYS
jgi:hypothetical protein